MTAKTHRETIGILKSFKVQVKLEIYQSAIKHERKWENLVSVDILPCVLLLCRYVMLIIFTKSIRLKVILLQMW